jgi:DNA-directed RNA polymerase subunit K/omega
MSIESIRVIDRLDEQVGGRFLLTALLQRRIQDIVRGSPTIIDGATPFRSALAEIDAGKIELIEPASDELL